MTRAALLERRGVLLRIYQNPDPQHEMQHIEVEVELAWIRTALASLPKDPPSEPASQRAAGWKRDGRAASIGRD